MTQSPLIPRILKQHFLRKKNSAVGFSTRLMGKKLALSHVYVSQIINGKRKIPVQYLDGFCELLDIDHDKKTALEAEIMRLQGWSKSKIRSQTQASKPADTPVHDWLMAPTKDFDLLEHWYHLAILEATRLKGYDGSAEYLARRLSLQPANIRHTLAKLEAAGYLKKNRKGILVKSSDMLEFRSGKNKRRISAYQGQIMDKAKKIMNEKSNPEDFEKRIITSATLTCTKESMPALRLKVAEFFQTLAEQAVEDKASPDNIYAFGVMFFPLTEDS